TRSVQSPDVRERVKELVRTIGIAHSFACPVCDTTVTGENLVRHVDKHSPADKATLNAATLTLTTRTKLLGNQFVLEKRVKGSDHLFHATNTVTKNDVLVSERNSERAKLDHPVIVPLLGVVDSRAVLHNVDG